MVLVPALAMTAVTAFLISGIDSATYGATGSVLVQDTAGDVAELGATEGADPSLRPTAVLLSTTLAEEGPAEQAPVDIEFATSTSSPLVDVTVTGEERDEVLDALTAALDGASAVLQDLQDAGDVSPDTVVRTVIAPEDATETDGGFQASATLLVQRRSGAGAMQDVGFTGTFLRERLRDDAVVAELQEQGATADFEVYPAEEGSPILRVDAEGPDAEAVTATAQLTIERLQLLLEDYQTERDIPEPLRANLSVIAFPLEAEVLESNTMRIVLAVVALGTLASIGAALMVDAALSGRRRRADEVSRNEAPAPRPARSNSSHSEKRRRPAKSGSRG
jgi:hypothetical protein